MIYVKKSKNKSQNMHLTCMVTLWLPVQVSVSRPLITNCPWLGCENKAQMKSQKGHKRYDR